MDNREGTLREDVNDIIKQRDNAESKYQIAEEENKELRRLIEELKLKLKNSEDYCRILEREIENKNGLIKGLAFAIRVNGVSGAEVNNVW